MLVLTRLVGERILVGKDITITVLDVRGNKVKIGIDAPRDTNVVREEVLIRIQQKEGENAQDSERESPTPPAAEPGPDPDQQV